MQNYYYEKPCTDKVIAMAYVPWQTFHKLYENPEEGYCEGTIFMELNKPFMGRRCANGK